MRYFLFQNYITGTVPADFRPLSACPARAQDLKSGAIINTIAPLPNCAGRKPGLAALHMFPRAKLSVPAGQANRGGHVLVLAVQLQIYRSCQASWHGARSNVAHETFRQIAICRATQA